MITIFNLTAKMRPENQALLNLFIVIIALVLLSLKTFLSLVVLYVSYNVYQIASNMQDNPFKDDKRRPREAYVTDQKKRDSVLKQSFAISKVPENLDAIVIGSGIGGLTTATLLSKIGKKVLVLEQHDQAGGCCHTFIDKGYEFDVGIHYIGEIGPKAQCLKITEKVSFNIASEASYIYIFSGQKFIKNAKNAQFCEFLKT